MGGRGMPGGGMGMQPSIILLKEGTDTSQGKAQLISNINACAAVADIVRTTLGPRGMDKLIHSNGKVRIHACVGFVCVATFDAQLWRMCSTARALPAWNAWVCPSDSCCAGMFTAGGDIKRRCNHHEGA